MKTQKFKELFKASTLALLISTSLSVYAAPKDQIIAIVGSTAILKSDLDQGVAEAAHKFQAQKKNSHRKLFCNSKCSISSLPMMHNLNK